MNDIPLSRRAAMRRGELEHKVFELEARHYYSDEIIDEDKLLRRKSLSYIAVACVFVLASFVVIYLSNSFVF